jgi:Mg/Co/Ni transporter MgtE
MEISFKTKELPESRKVNFDMPADLDAAGAYVISLQALARRHIEKSDEEIQQLVTDWNPNERSPAVKQSAFERASSALSKLSPEEKAALLAKLSA